MGETQQYEDKDITCKDCGKTFVWTGKGQQFFAEKGFTAPVRCKECREAKKRNMEKR